MIKTVYLNPGDTLKASGKELVAVSVAWRLDEIPSATLTYVNEREMAKRQDTVEVVLGKDTLFTGLAAGCGVNSDFSPGGGSVYGVMTVLDKVSELNARIPALYSYMGTSLHSSINALFNVTAKKDTSLITALQCRDGSICAFDDIQKYITDEKGADMPKVFINMINAVQRKVSGEKSFDLAGYVSGSAKLRRAFIVNPAVFLTYLSSVFANRLLSGNLLEALRTCCSDFMLSLVPRQSGGFKIAAVNAWGKTEVKSMGASDILSSSYIFDESVRRAQPDAVGVLNQPPVSSGVFGRSAVVYWPTDLKVDRVAHVMKPAWMSDCAMTGGGSVLSGINSVFQISASQASATQTALPSVSDYAKAVFLSECGKAERLTVKTPWKEWSAHVGNIGGVYKLTSLVGADGKAGVYYAMLSEVRFSVHTQGRVELVLGFTHSRNESTHIKYAQEEHPLYGA